MESRVLVGDVTRSSAPRSGPRRQGQPAVDGALCSNAGQGVGVGVGVGEQGGQPPVDGAQPHDGGRLSDGRVRPVPRAFYRLAVEPVGVGVGVGVRVRVGAPLSPPARVVRCPSASVDPQSEALPC